MNNLKHIITLSLCLTLSLAHGQLNVTIDGDDLTVCSGDTLFLSSTINNGSPTVYSWFSSDTSKSAFGSPDSDSTWVVCADSVQIVLKTAGNSTLFHDTISVSVKALPTICIGSDFEVCCDDDDVSLNLLFGCNQGGSWSCEPYADLLVDDLFRTSYACHRYYRTHYVAYNFTDSMTGCENSDSFEITVLPKPRLRLDGGQICQSDGCLNFMDDIVIDSSQISGSLNLSCIQCNGNDFSEIQTWTDSAMSLDNMFLCFDTSAYTLKNEDKDTVTIEVMYVGLNGCTKTEIVKFIIVKDGSELDIKFDMTQLKSPPNHCGNENDIQLYAKPYGGVWTSTDSLALTSQNKFSPSNADSIGVPIYFKYTYENSTSGCFGTDSIFATVDPPPQILGHEPRLDTFLINPNEKEYISNKITFKNNSYGAAFMTNFYGNQNLTSGFDFTNGIVSFTADIDSCELIRIIISAGGLGSCNDIDEYKDILLCLWDPASIQPSLDQSHFQAYPNPSSGAFTLECDEDFVFQLYSIDGRFIQDIILDDYSSFQIKTAGMYLLNYSNEHGKMGAIRLVVQP